MVTSITCPCALNAEASAVLVDNKHYLALAISEKKLSGSSCHGKGSIHICNYVSRSVEERCAGRNVLMISLMIASSGSHSRFHGCSCSLEVVLVATIK
jgi:hypothetical protein